MYVLCMISCIEFRGYIKCLLLTGSVYYVCINTLVWLVLFETRNTLY